ncbi:MAG TPA: sigma factor-like helix-turn-helix DNA-binding protein [Streptosporangiaceae bacterium]|nr:sigma factor-like helix-turn-helix DNA-binding protein [Streptosporangiaceae bacterium]
MTAAAADRTARFERLWATTFPEIAGYVRRRCAGAEADDVLAQVFTVAWRRLDHIPSPPQERLWMFGVARKALAEAERSARRRRRLGMRLASEALVSNQAGPSADPARERVIDALATLRPADREALRLVLWDALSHAEAATLLGCSANAFEIRYRRARAAVRDQLARRANAVTPDFPVRNTAPIRGDTS